MSCSPFDLRDYFLNELPESQHRQVQVHVRECQSCREELDRLQLTQATLLTLRDEEVPQRIGFVSDKIFEPSPWRRRWAAFWQSGARLGFASAAMLSAAILVSALTRPAPAPVPRTIAAAPAMVTTAEIDRRIDTAVTKAVADSEARQSAKTELMIRQVVDRDRQQMDAIRLAAARQIDYYQRNERLLAANYRPSLPDNGELK